MKKLALNLKRHLSTALTLATVGSALCALGQTTIYEECRFGPNNSNGSNNPDFTLGSGISATLSSIKSSAPGLPGDSSSCRFFSSAGTVSDTFTITPSGTNVPTVGVSYAVAVTFGNNTTSGQGESANIVVATADTGTTGLDTFAGTGSAFATGTTAVNTWGTIGHVTISSSPTFTFTWSSGFGSSPATRWYVDTVRFVPLGTLGTAQYWDISGVIGGTGSWDATSSNWNPASNGSGTPATYSSTGLAIFGGSGGTVTVDTVNGVTANGGLEFDVSGYTVQGGTLTLGPTNSIWVPTGVSVAINSAIAGTSGMVLPAGGTVNLGAPVTSLTGLVNLAGGATLNLTPTGSQSFSSLTGGGALNIGTASLSVGGDNTSTTYGGILSDGGAGNPGAFIKTGTGTLTLRAANTYSGKTTINQGALQIIADSGLGTAPSSLVANQVTLNASSGSSAGLTSGLATGTLTINANRGITLSGATNILAALSTGAREITLNCPITGSGGLTVQMMWPDFNATNTFAGDLVFAFTNNISARFNTNNSAGLGTIRIQPQTSSGTPFTMRNFAPTGISTTLTNAIVFDESVSYGQNYNFDTAGASGTFILSGNISGPATGGVSINDNSNGRGTVVLSGNNNAFTGGFNLEGGTLSLGSPTALGSGLFVVEASTTGSSTSPTYNLQATTPLTGVNALTNTVYLNMGSTFVIQGSTPLEFSGPMHLGVSAVGIEVINTAATIFSGPIDDQGLGLSLSLVTGSSGILKLSGSNSWTGGTFIYSGTLEGAASNSIPGNVSVVGGTLQLDSPNAMSTNAALSVTAGTVNLNFTGYQTVASVNGNSNPALYGASANNLGGAITGTGFINVAPFSITSEALDATGTNFVVCWTSVPGQNYDVLTNTSLTGNGAWVSAGNTDATDTTTCFTLPGGIVGHPSVFVRIQAP